MKKIKKALEEGVSAREVELSKEEEVLSKELSLLTAKPVLVVINAGEGEIKKTGWGGGRDGEKDEGKGD